MRITKLQHATLLVEKDGESLLIDPGSYTDGPIEVENLVGVVITHEHADHWTPQHLEALRSAFPGVPIYGPEGVVRAAEGFDVTRVSPGDHVSAGSFSLRFFGGKHALIHSSIPVIDNVGVLVDERFYYPGDSYTVPEGYEVELLAAPAGAPWLKIGEAMDFLIAVAPRRAFGTHDMTVSEVGRGFHARHLGLAADTAGTEFRWLEPGESIEL